MGEIQTIKNPVFRLYGRQKTRTLSERQRELMEQLLPNLDVSIPDLTKKEHLVLEIGFGFGEHLAYLAEQSPKTFFVGFEPFVNGVVSLLHYVDERDLANVSIHQGDVRTLFPEMPDQLFSAIYLLYPDPWPKKRHFKRRFVQIETLATLHRLLAPHGTLYIASDHDTYQTWIEEHIEADPIVKTFDWANKSTKNTAWNGWMRTRYEEKAFREGRVPRYYVLTKK